MRSFWNEVPMLRIAIALIAGILIKIFLSAFFVLTPTLLVGANIIFWIAFSVVLLIHQTEDVHLAHRFRILNGISLNSLFISLGFILAMLRTELNSASYFSKMIKPESSIVVIINKPPQVRENVVRAIAKVIEVVNENQSSLAMGKMMLTFTKDSSSMKLAYGDELIVSGGIKEVEPPKNPEEFNLKRYQAFQNVFHQSYLVSGQWKLLQHEAGNSFYTNVYRMRNYFLQIIQKHVGDPNDMAVASAILLGYRDDMSGEVMSAYAGSGVLHVLCVSGLHVGIVFVMLNWLLSEMDGFGGKWRTGKAIAIILFIWFYAFLTGLSPSVLRAATMFSILQIGKTFVRHTNTYNTIAASAVILMLFNPYIITEIGFQLSYLAVIGIVYLYPKISALLLIGSSHQPKYVLRKNLFQKANAFIRYDLKWASLNLLDATWKIVAVSLAAQIATAPLSLYYFHQFPNLFLIANLVVIPMSSFIIYAGTGLLAFSKVALLSDLATGIFNFLLHELNRFIFAFQQIPYAVTKGISISSIQMLLMYLFFVFILCFEVARKPKLILASLIMLWMICAIQANHDIERGLTKEVVVYSVPKEKAMSFISEKRIINDIHEKLLLNKSSLSFHILPHWWWTGAERVVIEKNNRIRLDFGTLHLFEGKKVLIVDSEIKHLNEPLQSRLTVDMLVLTGDQKIYLDDLKKVVNFKEVIFDGTNKWWRINYWKKDCERLKIKYWNVAEQGAYIYKIVQ